MTGRGERCRSLSKRAADGESFWIFGLQLCRELFNERGGVTCPLTAGITVEGFSFIWPSSGNRAGNFLQAFAWDLNIFASRHDNPSHRFLRLLYRKITVVEATCATVFNGLGWIHQLV